MGDKIRSGFRVVGLTSEGDLHSWYFPDTETANAFAKSMCTAWGTEYDVLKYVGSWKRSDPPIEFIEAYKTPPDAKEPR